ncbi:hypothetical protein BgiBS90_005076 [Biomphalaria glabrata]|nr:hypothetical protein BgiBS90_005076 [Biomphalaria glabrata]
MASKMYDIASKIIRQLRLENYWIKTLQCACLTDLGVISTSSMSPPSITPPIDDDEMRTRQRIAPRQKKNVKSATACTKSLPGSIFRCTKQRHEQADYFETNDAKQL